MIEVWKRDKMILSFGVATRPRSTFWIGENIEEGLLFVEISEGIDPAPKRIDKDHKYFNLSERVWKQSSFLEILVILGLSKEYILSILHDETRRKIPVLD